MTRAGFPHSDTPGSQLGCQLPRAYRRLQRPSSALDAKASTMCPSQLAKQTLNKNNNTTHHQDKKHPQRRAAPSSFCKDTHYKNKHPHKNNPTKHNPGLNPDAGVAVRAMLASTIQK